MDIRPAAAWSIVQPTVAWMGIRPAAAICCGWGGFGRRARAAGEPGVAPHARAGQQLA
jgi:hypothetical protein